MKKVSENAYLQYLRSRPAASADSSRRVKEISFSTCSIHPIFETNDEKDNILKESLLDRMKNYRPQGVNNFIAERCCLILNLDFLQTIFEICGKNKSEDYITMKQKRAVHKDKINAYHEKMEIKKEIEIKMENDTNKRKLIESNQKEIEETFKEVVLPKRRKIDDIYKKKLKKLKDDENYIPYAPADRHTEEG